MPIPTYPPVKIEMKDDRSAFLTVLHPTVQCMRCYDIECAFTSNICTNI